ncbi:MAG: ABC transporter permease [Rhodospirillales bacterium]|nr:ABC transporter permease [Rhodospirillales bacterium]
MEAFLANPEQALVQLLTGLAGASSLFLVASGLSIIFGVTRIVNFAHGSFYMLGAFIAYSALEHLPRTPLGFWGGVLAAALAVAAIGLVVELVLLRRIYRAPELFQLLATFGVVLVVQDIALAVWGAEDLLGPRAPGLRGAVTILGQPFPAYDLVLVFIGPAVLGLLMLLFHATRWGVLVRAATQDREMVQALGVNQAWLFTGVFALGSFLAGLGGALQVPREAASLHMDLAIIAEVFVVVVVGGLGSIPGAFLAALLIAVVHAFGIVIFPKITLALIFLVMAVVLVFRPYGLLGRPLAPQRASGDALAARGYGKSDYPGLGLAVIAALALLAFAGGDYALTVLTEILILALFAASLHFMMGPGGMASFGHAAYFGLGAYGAALLVKYWAAPMALGLLAAPLAAGFMGVVFGWFCVRLSGVYLAMLTLAFAQIVWSIAFQWVEVTGGDNGVLGVWPSEWAHAKEAYYLLALALCGASILLLRRMIFAPFGFALRAGRDSPLRAEATGIDLALVQRVAFSIAAAFAGLAGGLFAYATGSVFPTYISISRSVDALLMVLLGGVETLTGPVIGAALFVGLQEQLARATELWRLLLGLIIILLVLAFPQGIAGAAQRLVARRA